MRDIARPMPRAPPLTMMFFGGAWNAILANRVIWISESEGGGKMLRTRIYRCATVDSKVRRLDVMLNTLSHRDKRIRETAIAWPQAFAFSSTNILALHKPVLIVGLRTVHVHSQR